MKFLFYAGKNKKNNFDFSLLFHNFASIFSFVNF